MSEPGRELEELLRRVRTTMARPTPVSGARERSWRKVEERSAARPRQLGWMRANAVAVALLIAGAFAGAELSKAGTTTTPVPAVISDAPATAAAPPRLGAFGLEFEDDSAAAVSVSKDGAVEILMERGGVRVQNLSNDPTLRATVTAGGTRVDGSAFEMRIASDRAVTVVALADSVELHRGNATTRLRRGETWRHSGAAAITPAPPPAPIPQAPAVRTRRRAKPTEAPEPAITSVAPEPVTAPPAEVVPVEGGRAAPTEAELWTEARRLTREGRFSAALSKLDALAEGAGPYAAMALYEEGRLRAEALHDLAGAQRAFASYRARFPRGALRQEVELGSLNASLAQGELSDALEVADDFLALFPSSERTEEVRLVRAHILRRQHRCIDARPIYSSLSEGRGRFGSEALFFGGLCALEMNDTAAGHRAFERYLERFPNGPRRAEALRALDREP